MEILCIYVNPIALGIGCNFWGYLVDLDENDT